MMEKIAALIQRQGDCGDIGMKATLSTIGPTTTITTTMASIPSSKNTTLNIVNSQQAALIKNSNDYSIGSPKVLSRQLKKSLTDQSSDKSSDLKASLRLNFRKSHTCGSLYAKCNCRTPSPPSSNLLFDNKINSSNNVITRPAATITTTSSTTIINTASRASTTHNNYNYNTNSNNKWDKKQNNIRSSSLNSSSYCSISDEDKRPKKLFQSYSHPDTTFIFTDENKNPSRDVINRNNSITTKSGKVEFKNLKRSSSPNLGNYAILDVAVHPEVLLKISTKTAPKDHQTQSQNHHQQQHQHQKQHHQQHQQQQQQPEHQSSKSEQKYLSTSNKTRPLLRRSYREYQSSDSENSIEVLCDSVRSQSETEVDHIYGGSNFSRNPSQDSQSDCDTNCLESDDINNRLTISNNSASAQTAATNLEYHKFNALSYQQLKSPQKHDIDPAQKYFIESGILGPMGNSSTCLIRKTSKIMQDPHFIEHIRKNSKLLRQSTEQQRQGATLSRPTSTSTSPINDDLDCTSTTQRSLMPNLKITNNTDDRDSRIKNLEDEVKNLKDIIRSRDSEIYKLKREAHKLKSVLQQTAQRLPADGELLSSLQTHHGMASHHPSPLAASGVYSNMNLNNNLGNGLAGQHQGAHLTTSNNDVGNEIDPSQQAFCDYKHNSNPTSCGVSGAGACTSGNVPKTILHHGHGATPAVKKQGVSGESSDSSSQQSINIPIPKFEKDFRSKQLIKDAIMDNDFLKNIDSTQVRELVESMHSLEVAKGEYVIREGEAGAHLYVSAEGEFEVIKGGKILGNMGPGKAFGELAILYNCTRTASIRVLSDARVWVLDRRVFQQIMMRTGMQRIEENVNFLKSVPLLKNLPNDVLTKIADVLEVEFYPASTYIIRQGASGDTFFLISQGNVKVTQRLANATEEKEIRTLSRGDYFGEQALINEDKRTANIIALSPGVECLTLDRESFTHLIGDLCELKEKDYGDENRVLAMKFAESRSEIFGANVKQEYLDIELNHLELVSTLGIGGFGRVELVKCYRENRVNTFALKCLKKQHIVDTRQEEHVFSERTIMLSCNTPFICRLYRTFRDTKYVYMLLEACMGGEVWTILRDRGSFDDNTTQFIIGCVLQAFEFLHSRGIIYRDLKPENLMLDERGYVKLVDFGFAKHIGHSSKTWTFCGTPEYVAPEIILNKGHDRAVDYWALGILIHELLNGTPPFTANDPMKTYNIILKGIDLIDFPKHMSRSAIMLIKKLCRDIPAERLGYQRGGIQDIKKHKWFQGFDWDGLSNLTLIPPFMRPVSHSLDTSYFDKFPVDAEIPPDEQSGWDIDF